MRFPALVILALLAQPTWATHILGGVIYYSYLGNDDYQVTLQLYRDCGPDNTQNTALDLTATIGVFNSSGVWVKNAVFSLPGEVTVPVVVDNPCLTVPPSICTKTGTYTGVINLPSGTGGYTLSYQRCCRSPAVINILAPNTQGMTCTVRVPDPNVTGPNSSPVFMHDPPMVLCLNQAIELDQLATDADGDSLAYALASPFTGGTVANPTPNPPAAPPYVPVTWANGYSTQNQLNSTPPMTFGTDDGTLSMQPTMIGNFAVCISVREYRNGVLLSTVIRDFRFLVVACEQVVTSAFAEQSEFCNGLEVDLVNQSVSADTYHWDFGVPETDNDTSAAVNPSFIFPAGGTYTIQLIANPGWPCADTSSRVYTVYDPLEVSFDVPAVVCSSDLPLALTATGTFPSAADLQWDFGGGVTPDPHAASTTVGWSTTGPHVISIDVEHGGCTASHADTVFIFPLPIPDFTVDSAGCAPFTPVFTNLSSAWMPMSFTWDLGDGSVITDSTPVHSYQNPGTYDVSLTVTTDTGCVTSRTLVKPNAVQVWALPLASATALPQVTTVMEPDITFTDHSVDAVSWDFLVEGTHYDTATFTHRFNGSGWYTALLTVANSMGCTDTTSMRVFIGDHLFFAPTAFSPNSDAMNEVWKPSVQGARAYLLQVFNRWGQLVFSTTDPDEGWDGEGALPGVYGYKAWLTEWGPLEKEYNGSFVLIR